MTGLLQSLASSIKHGTPTLFPKGASVRWPTSTVVGKMSICCDLLPILWLRAAEEFHPLFRSCRGLSYHVDCTASSSMV